MPLSHENVATVSVWDESNAHWASENPRLRMQNGRFTVIDLVDEIVRNK